MSTFTMGRVQQVDQYPAATMETAQAITEELLYANLPATRVDKSTVSGYPTDKTTSPNDKIAKVNGSGNKIGLSGASVLSKKAHS